jgi:hypothetical protein
MPAQLWQAAVALAREQGVYAISQDLRISYDRLKAQVDGAAKAQKARGSKGRLVSEFVEIVPTLSTSSKDE